RLRRRAERGAVAGLLGARGAGGERAAQCDCERRRACGTASRSAPARAPARRRQQRHYQRELEADAAAGRLLVARAARALGILRPDARAVPVALAVAVVVEPVVALRVLERAGGGGAAGVGGEVGEAVAVVVGAIAARRARQVEARSEDQRHVRSL